MTNEFIQIENFQSKSEKKWFKWIDQCEKKCGHSLDGDQSKDGYSIDFAYDAFLDGCSVEAYCASLKLS